MMGSVSQFRFQDTTKWRRSWCWLFDLRLWAMKKWGDSEPTNQSGIARWVGFRQQMQPGDRLYYFEKYAAFPDGKIMYAEKGFAIVRGDEVVDAILHYMAQA